MASDIGIKAGRLITQYFCDMCDQRVNHVLKVFFDEHISINNQDYGIKDYEDFLLYSRGKLPYSSLNIFAKRP